MGKYLNSTGMSTLKDNLETYIDNTDVVVVSEMPESSRWDNKIVFYIGETTDKYIKNTFYQWTVVGEDKIWYAWKRDGVKTDDRLWAIDHISGKTYDNHIVYTSVPPENVKAWSSSSYIYHMSQDGSIDLIYGTDSMGYANGYNWAVGVARSYNTSTGILNSGYINGYNNGTHNYKYDESNNIYIHSAEWQPVSTHISKAQIDSLFE